jgi:hypothetical protein
MASALDNILQRPQPPPGARPQTVRGEGPSPPTMLRRVSMSLSAGPDAPGSERSRSMSLSAGPCAPGARPLTARPRLASSANVLETVSRASQQSAGPLADAERLDRLSSRSCSPKRPPVMEPSRRGSFKLSSAGAGGEIPPQPPLRVAPAAMSSQNMDQSAGPLADAERLDRLSSRSCSPKRPPVMEPSRRGSFKLSSAGAGGEISPQLPLRVAPAAMSSQDMDQSAGPLADAERLDRLSARPCSPKRPPVMEPSRRGSFKLSSAGAGGEIPPQLPLRVAPAAMSSQDMDQSAGPLADAERLDRLSSRSCSPKRPPVMEPSRRGSFKLSSAGAGGEISPQLPLRVAPAAMSSQDMDQSAGPLADAERLDRLSSRSCSPKRPPVMEPSRRGSFKLSSAGAGGEISPQLPLRVAPAAMSSQDMDQSAGPLADAGRLDRLSSRSCSPKRPPVMEPSRRGSFKLSSAGAGGEIPPQLPLRVAPAAMSSQDMDQSAGPLADAERLDRLSSRSCSPKRPPVMEPSRRGSFKLSSAGAGGEIPPQLPLRVAPAAMSSQDMDQSAGPLADAGRLDRLSSRSCSPKRPPVMEPSRRGSFKLSSAGAGGEIPPQPPLQVSPGVMSDRFSSFAQSHNPRKSKTEQLRTAVASGNTLAPQDGALDCSSHKVPKSSTARLSTSKRGSLFSRQSVADIVAEARAKDQQREHERKEHEDTAQVAANRQNSDCWQSDDTKLNCDQRLTVAASSAAAERLGRIVLARTRSRSTSPKRTTSMERQHDGDGDSSRAPLLPQRSGLNGNASPLAILNGSLNSGRTPSTDDTALNDANQLDRIAQSDEEYRRQRSLIRKALREFRPSEDDWLDICYIL